MQAWHGQAYIFYFSGFKGIQKMLGHCCCSLTDLIFQGRLKLGSFLSQGNVQALGNSGFHTLVSVAHMKNNFSLEFVTVKQQRNENTSEMRMDNTEKICRKFVLKYISLLVTHKQVCVFFLGTLLKAVSHLLSQFCHPGCISTNPFC